MKTRIRIQVSSDLDYENLIAEVFMNERLIGILSNEPNQGLVFKFGNSDISVVLDDLENALKMAKEELLK